MLLYNQGMDIAPISKVNDSIIYECGYVNICVYTVFQLHNMEDMFDEWRLLSLDLFLDERGANLLSYTHLCVYFSIHAMPS